MEKQVEGNVEDKQNVLDDGKEAAGVTSSKKLLLQLSRMENKPLRTSLPSPILQVDRLWMTHLTSLLSVVIMIFPEN